MNAFRRGRLSALQAAAQALTDFGADQSKPIDVFEAIDVAGLELRFRPLGALLGAIVPGEPAGVLINTRRPVSVLRYTAAHEIGHWYLDQDFLAIDTEENVLGTPHEERERNAQLFAAHFLMPLPLLYATASRYGVKKGGTVRPVDVYAMSRDMQVSYQAAVHHLANCRFINESARRGLLQFKPQQIKTELAGRKLANPVGDVWALEPSGQDLSIEVRTGDEVIVVLPENRTTGYRWMDETQLAKLPEPGAAPAPARFGGSENQAPVWSEILSVNQSVLKESLVLPEIVEDEPFPYVADDFVHEQGERKLQQLSRLATESPSEGHSYPGTVGRAGVRRISMLAQESGTWHRRLLYFQPFDPRTPPADSITIETKVRPLPETEVKERWLEKFRLLELEEPLDDWPTDS